MLKKNAAGYFGRYNSLFPETNVKRFLESGEYHLQHTNTNKQIILQIIQMSSLCFMGSWMSSLPIPRRRKITNGRVIQGRLYRVFRRVKDQKKQRRWKSKIPNGINFERWKSKNHKNQGWSCELCFWWWNFRQFTSNTVKIRHAVNMWKEIPIFHNTDQIEVWIVVYNKTEKREEGGKEKYDVEY